MCVLFADAIRLIRTNTVLRHGSGVFAHDAFDQRFQGTGSGHRKLLSKTLVIAEQRSATDSP